MSTIHEPFVKEVATNKPTAVQNFTVAGVGVTNFRAISAAYSNGDIIPITAKNADNSLWEESECTLSTGVLTRTRILKSSNADAAVDFSGSTTDITLSVGWQSYKAMVFENKTITALAYVSGLKVKWSTATQIKVESGFAYVEESGVIVELASEQTINPTLSASAWHYVYLKTDGTCEVSTTAPIAYSGLAMSKNTAGQKYRLLGQFKTDASSNIYEFTHKPESNSWFYPKAGNTSIFRALSNGQSTTSTTVSLSAFVPTISTQAWLKASNTDATYSFVVGDGRTMSTVNDSFFVVTPGVRSSGLFIADASQQLSYLFTGAPTGGGYVDVLGYGAGR